MLGATNDLGFVSVEELSDFFLSMPAHLKTSKVALSTKARFERFEGLNGLAIPDSLDMVLEDMSGQAELFSDVIKNRPSKYKIVFFGASWCAACRNAEHWFSEWYPQLNSVEVSAFNISIDKKKAAWQQSVKEDALDWNSYLLKETKPESMFSRLTLDQSIPVILLLNEENKIIHVSSDVRQIVKRLPMVCFEITI